MLKMALGELVVAVVIASALLVSPFTGASQSSSCHFPAIFNFGDSNSDTGSWAATFATLNPPNGETFFGRPSGRLCDGRLIIDFIAEKLGFPYLDAYLDALGSNFRHGANFASSSATIQNADANLYRAGYSPLSLDVQLSQFKRFKRRVTELYQKGDWSQDSLPKPEDFSRSLYMLDIGQNDLHFALESTSEEQAKASIPHIIGQFSSAVEILYKQGARALWIHNSGPIGCLPYFVHRLSPGPGNVETNGCIRSYNEVVQEFNRQLKDNISGLQGRFRDAVIVYVDIYSAKYGLVSNAKDYGFSDPFGYCCGNLGIREYCWEENKTANSSEVYPTACSDPSEYISWDGIHYTEAANQWVAKNILAGSFSEPRIPITEACHLAKDRQWCQIS